MSVKGKVISRGAIERPLVNYRKLEALNQSMLRIFDENPVQFFREFKLGEEREQKSTPSIIIGDIVDFYLLGCDTDDEIFDSRFDERFALMEGVKGSGQVFELTDILFGIVMKNRNKETGEINISFTECFEEAYRTIKSREKYKGDKNTIEKVMDDFDKNGKEYFKMRVDNIGKTVVDSSILEKAKNVGRLLKVDPFTRDVFTDNMDDYLPHFPIEWNYFLDEDHFIACKAEIDLLKVDDKEKVIYLYDLKCTYDNESFQYSYIKNYYYLQAAFYHMAVQEWKKEKEMADYRVEFMRFVVGDTSMNNRRPLVYSTDATDLYKGMYGFTLNKNKYKGVISLLQEIAWAEESSNWNVSKESYDNNGKLKLTIQYD